MRASFVTRGREEPRLRGGDKRTGRRISVLMVDTDPATRESTRELLENHYGEGIDLATCGGGEECLTQAKVIAPQILLMDVGRPGQDGLGTIPLLHVLYPRIQVIALSAQDEERSRRLVSAAGASGLVFKSALEKDLIPAIEWALNAKPSVPPRRRLARAFSAN